MLKCQTELQLHMVCFSYVQETWFSYVKQT